MDSFSLGGDPLNLTARRFDPVGRLAAETEVGHLGPGRWDGSQAAVGAFNVGWSI